MAAGLAAPPNWVPPLGTPPTLPASTVSVISWEMPSSAATRATRSGIPTPKFTTAPGRSSMAARRAMTFRASSGSGASASAGARNSPVRLPS